jgi:hypothetical protein
MTRVVTESTVAVGAIDAKRLDQKRRADDSRLNDSLDAIVRPEEKELLRELVHDLRTIRYGSIVLVMHEGRLVEISKTVRIRKNFTSEIEKESSSK